MTVRDLKEILEGLADDTLVVIPGSDHSYRLINRISPRTAIKHFMEPSLSEDYGDLNPDDWKDDKRVKVLVVGD
ncbi:hypothetical protein LCGC14_1518620 [marine sediment metagenome]|uniref:Uncharacterized protein n=1 Tax=marine sediment metagenome TaxID=412755 RepID=A0A0F9JK48_9ZZZZ